MKVRIRRISWPIVTQTGQHITDVNYIAQVKKHWWSRWKYITEDYEDPECKRFKPLKPFRDISEVKKYLREQYLDRLCK